MGVSHSTARLLAPASFSVNFAAQMYGMLSKPNMKDIHDRNLSFFSPNPYFISAFFFPQQLFQLAWLARLWTLKPKDGRKAEEVQTMTNYVPVYVAGNLCIAAWMFFWNKGDLKTANYFVQLNTALQLLYTFTAAPDGSKEANILTLLVSKTFAGIGVLDALHNGSLALNVGQTPSDLVKGLTAVAFGGLAIGADWVFGTCLAYDLVALAVGQRKIGNIQWSNLLGGYAVAVMGIVAQRNKLTQYRK